MAFAPGLASAQVYGYSYGYMPSGYSQTITTPYWCGSYWSSLPCNSYGYQNYNNYGYQNQYYYQQPYYNNYQYSYQYGYCPQGYYYQSGLCYPNNYSYNNYYNQYPYYNYNQTCYHTSAPWYGPSYQYPCHQMYW